MNDSKDMTQPPRKKVHIETWGCQMNVADSENMLRMLQEQGYDSTDQVDDADLVLLNTCHIREKATNKVLSRLGRLREIAKTNDKMKVAVAGCVAQAEGKKLIDKAKNIDILLGPGKIEDLPKLIQEQDKTKKAVSSLGFHNKKKDPESAKYSIPTEVRPTVAGKNEVSRFINIAQGCNNFCTFCVVPFTRGREISRPTREIVSEATNLIAEGAKEITLLGQNVNSYGLDLVEGEVTSSPFVGLLKSVLAVPGLERLRFTTSNPHDFTYDIAELFAQDEKLGRYIHLPVQCGDDTVLERMKRKVTVAEYMERVGWLRDIDPEMALSTDLIVGFPGETEEQFQGTLKLVEQVRFSFIYAFKYSPRKGTAAARFPDIIPEEVKSDRLARLNALQDKITAELNQAEIGRTRHVLCHYESKKEPGIYYGRTDHFRLVRIKSDTDLVGQSFSVKITEANNTALVGELVH